jgi:hypothetical protein
MSTWFEHVDPAKLAAWATLASAISSVVLLGATFWLAVLTRVLAKETRLTREKDERADVVCSVEHHEEHIVALNLVITNVGRAVARDVTILVLQGGGYKEPFRPPNLGFSSMLPGSAIRTEIGVYPSIPKDERAIKVAIEFSDRFGRHVSVYEQDLQSMEGMVRMGTPANYKTANALEDLVKITDRWHSEWRDSLKSEASRP